MIQRIQSVYLLFATVLMGVAFKLPLAIFIGKTSSAKLYAIGVVSNENRLLFATTAFMTLFVVATLLPLVTVFLYKRRKLQMGLCVAEIVLLLGVLGAIAYNIFWGVDATTTYPTFGAAIPLVALVFVWLAWRAIRRDERLVRSLDRIR